MMMRSLFVCVNVLLFSAWLCAQDTQEYRIGVDDRLGITFWQEPDLNSEVRVREDGKISLPVIGDIQASGRTTSQLAKLIIDQMAFYNPAISQATVVVTEYNSQTVVISGAVNTPGDYHFERIPTLLDVLRQAGGGVPGADLSNVTIIRQEADQVRAIRVDLLDVIESGDLTKLPKLQAKDLINVPMSAAGPGGTPRPVFEGKNVYYIYGAVVDPGAKSLTPGTDLMDAIGSAGGFTETADLKNVRVVIKDIEYSSVLYFSMSDFVKSGRPVRYRLRPEDTIIIPYRRPPSFASTLPQIIIPAIVTAVATALLVDYLTADEAAPAGGAAGGGE